MWYKVNKRLVGTKQVRPSWWKPWANTLAYYPLNSTTTVNDTSWNNKTMTNSSVSFWTYQWIDCAYGSSRKYLSTPTLSWAKTISLWAYWAWHTSDSTYSPTFTYGTGSTNNLQSLYEDDKYTCWNSSGYVVVNSQIKNKWYYYTLALDTTEKRLYFNWQLVGTANNSSLSDWMFYFFCFINNTSWNNYYNWWISNVIIENKVWTATEISNYYNQTKSKYWL